jgi:hypothetical protein
MPRREDAQNKRKNDGYKMNRGNEEGYIVVGEQNENESRKEQVAVGGEERGSFGKRGTEW